MNLKMPLAVTIALISQLFGSFCLAEETLDSYTRDANLQLHHNQQKACECAAKALSLVMAKSKEQPLVAAYYIKDNIEILYLTDADGTCKGLNAKSGQSSGESKCIEDSGSRVYQLSVQAYRLAEAGLGKDSIYLSDFVLTMAKYAPEKDKEALYKNALKFSERRYGLSHPETASVAEAMASYYHDRKNYPKAEEYYKKALDIRQQNYLSIKSYRALTAYNRAINLSDGKKLKDALDSYSLSLKLYEEEHGKESLMVSSCLDSMAELNTELGQYAQAEKLYKRSLTIKDKLMDADNQLLLGTLNKYASVLRKLGKINEAALVEKRAAAVKTKLHLKA
jgi:tetratricopeptide (TPR) repeat protein